MNDTEIAMRELLREEAVRLEAAKYRTTRLLAEAPAGIRELEAELAELDRTLAKIRTLLERNDEAPRLN